jgi:hypothetical protein
MAHYARPVKQGIDLVVAVQKDRYGYAVGSSMIHAAGCVHSKGSRVVSEALPVEYDVDGVYADDWYNVAPCAANGKGLVCTSPNCPDH